MTDLTAARLKQILRYDPLTGTFTWREKIGKHVIVGAKAGCTTPGERTRITIYGHAYKAHRLAWLYMTGAWPTQQIDHINGDFTDNRFENLRDVSEVINRENTRVTKAGSRTGVLGVYLTRGMFVARICVRKRQRYLGSYPTVELAHAAYLAAKRELHEGCTI